MKRYRFSKEINHEFAVELRARVNNYFKTTGLSKNANIHMIIKTAVALSIYIIPFVLILFSGIVNIPILFGLWIVMGFGKSMVGTAVMHDALHHSYSKSGKINQLLGFSATIIGMDSAIWKIQHNVLHHTYTNVEHADEDIQPRFIFRMSPFQKRRWFHRYQHIYAIFFYSLFTIITITVKDFIKVYHYRKKGLVKKGMPFNGLLFGIILRKVLYHAVFLGLPLYLLPLSPWIIISMFIVLHMVTGIILSLIFQPAHVTPTSTYIEQDDELIEENWSVHQLLTTSNYGMNSKVLSWFIGGLNFQVEHHLFPNICHIHYPELSKIVQKTSEEYHLPYYATPSFLSAIIAHFSMLKKLGTSD